LPKSLAFQRLAELMIDFDVGITVLGTYNGKRVDSDYFDDTSVL
jgi:restriction system protein